MKSGFKIGILLAFLSGCIDTSVQPVSSDPYQRWKSSNLHDYTLDQVRICFCGGSGQTMRLTIRSDTVAFVTRLSDDSILPPSSSAFYLTIDSLFSIIRNPGADSLGITYDSTYGYPNKLDINPQQHPVDGGVLIESSNLQTNKTPGGCACTALFAYFDVIVVDASGAPVTGLTPTLTAVRTGRAISPAMIPTGNQYPVFTDGELSLIDPAGELIRFTAVNSQGSVTGDFVFDAPGSCHCHMHKVSGPDTLVLR